MKKYAVLLLVCAVFPVFLSAQVKDIVINIRGGYNLLLDLGEGRTVTVTETGDIIDFEMEGPIEVGEYKLWSRGSELISSIGDVGFEYYPSGSKPKKVRYNVKRIGDLEFEYIEENEGSRTVGKIKRIGDIAFEYYDEKGEDTYRRSKIKRIGSIIFDFYIPGDFPAQNRASQTRYGLLKSIDGNIYDYYAFGTIYAGVSGYNRTEFKEETEEERVTTTDPETGETKTETKSKSVKVEDKVAMADNARRFGQVQMRTLSSYHGSTGHWYRASGGMGISGKQVISIDGIIIYVVDK